MQALKLHVQMLTPASKKTCKRKTPFGEQKVEGKLKSLINSGQLNVTSELEKAVSKSDIIVITVQAKLDDKKKIDYSEVLNAIKKLEQHSIQVH